MFKSASVYEYDSNTRSGLRALFSPQSEARNIVTILELGHDDGAMDTPEHT